MTTEELERDLSALAEPREADEHLRRATRTRLDEQLRARRRHRLQAYRGVPGAQAHGWLFQ